MKTKKIKLYLMLVAVLTLSLGFASCDDDDDKDVKPKTNTIVDIAVADPNFSILVQALTKANLVTTLNGSTDYTVFAPTNAAFVSLLAELKLTSLDDIPEAELKKILLYHVVGGTNKSSALSTGYYPSASERQTASFYSIYFSKEKLMLNNRAKVTKADVMADNGVIHVIDKVILQQNIVDFAVNNPTFSILVEALAKADLVSTLQGDGPFTVFAPTNTAFESLFTALGVTGIAQLSKEALTPILLSHVVQGNVRSTDLTNGMVQTLNTDKSISVNITNGVKLDGKINVIIADVQGTNGVIHAIDKVIVPQAQ